MKRSGMTFLETLVLGIVLMLVLAIGFEGLSSLKTGYERTLDFNAVTGDARQAVDALGDHLRNADRCSATSGCVTNSVLHSASASSITYYTDTAGTQVSYLVSNGSLVRRVSGTDTILVRNVTSLTLTYYKCTTYNGTWTSIANPAQSDLPYICGVQIVVTCNQSGSTFTTESTIRLRNSPKKGPLVGYT